MAYDRNACLDALRDIARIDDPLGMLDSITDGPRHPDEDAEYDDYLEQQNQDWWQQMDADEDYIQDHDFAEYQGALR